MSAIRTMSVVSVVALAWAACGKDADPGKLKVTWEIGGAKTCQEAGLKTVEIHLLQGGEEALVPPDQAACDQGTAGVIVDHVSAGTYSVLLKGLDAAGKAIYSAQRDKVKVSSGKTAVLDSNMSLAMTTATVHLKWQFSTPGLCSTFGIESMEISVTDSTSKPVSGVGTSQPCDPKPTKENPQGGILIEDLRPQEEFSFVVYGLNADKKRVYWGKKTLMTEPGGDHEVIVELHACQGPNVCN